MLYGGTDFVSRAIQFRTWSDVAHIEVYAGGVHSLASRNGIGVGKYLFRAKGLRYVLRNPAMTPEKFAQGLEWFKTVNGQPYAWGDLLRFYGLNVNAKGMICSQFGANFFAACSAPLFSKDYPAGEVCPSDNLVTRDLGIIWSYRTA